MLGSTFIAALSAASDLTPRGARAQRAAHKRQRVNCRVQLLVMRNITTTSQLLRIF